MPTPMDWLPTSGRERPNSRWSSSRSLRETRVSLRDLLDDHLELGRSRPDVGSQSIGVGIASCLSGMRAPALLVSVRAVGGDVACCGCGARQSDLERAAVW